MTLQLVASSQWSSHLHYTTCWHVRKEREKITAQVLNLIITYIAI